MGPDALRWAHGERTITCSVIAYDGSPRTMPARGTAPVEGLGA